jgi:hypothetical protein
MPKVEIDYSNTIIYKIVCKDQSISDVYVGHTTNFVQRKYSHKQSCYNIKSPCYNLKLYKTIRDNGNWSNWEMSIVNFYNCKNQLEARQKEQEHYVLLGATLNTVEPLPFKTESPKALSNITNDEKIFNNSSSKFVCSICDFKCCKKGDFTRHNVTIKHIKKTNTKIINNLEYKCSCGKIYKHMSSLSFHKKKCVIKNPEMTDKELIATLLMQNAKLIEQNAIFLNNMNIASDAVKEMIINKA